MGKIMTLLALVSLSVIGSPWGAFGDSRLPGDVSHVGRNVLSDRSDLSARGRGSAVLVLAQAAAPSASPSGEMMNLGVYRPGEGDTHHQTESPPPNPNATDVEVRPPAAYVHIGGAGEGGENIWVPNRECFEAVEEALERHTSAGVADQTCAAIMQKALAIQREHPERPLGPTPQPRETPAPPPGVSSSGP